MERIYQTPMIEFIDVYSEGILCASGDQQLEGLNENEGSWGGR
jgi:hypothetical protein